MTEEKTHANDCYCSTCWAAAQVAVRNQGNPDDIRALGWAVAVHNDYTLNGERFTFWLFTNGERAVKGEGKTDAEALNIVRERVRAIEQEKFSTLSSYYGG